MILRLKPARRARPGRRRAVAAAVAEAELIHGRIDKRSGAFFVESEHVAVEFPAHEALVVWHLLKQAFDGKFLESPVGGRGPRRSARRRPGAGARARARR